MDKLFQFFAKVVLIFVGAFFFFCMLIFGMFAVCVFLVRLLWCKITGKPSVYKMQSFSWTAWPSSGSSYNKDPRPSQRVLEDVTDVEVKEVYDAEKRSDQ